MIPQTLRDLFDAENRRDWERLETCLAPDVTWELHGSAGIETLHGRKAYLARLEDAYRHDDGAGVFDVVWSCVSERNDRIALLLRNRRGEASMEVFDLNAGLIAREWEFILGATEEGESHDRP